MAERPILFSGPMVRAILENRKTNTRRLVTKNTTTFDGGPWCNYAKYPDAFYFDQAWVDNSFPDPILKLPWDQLGIHSIARVRPRIAIGDQLWVRENWRTLQKFDDLKPSHVIDDMDIIDFAATGYCRNPLWAWGKTRPSIFLPQWASRIMLEVTDVRFQRLQDINEADAIAEGIKHIDGNGFDNGWKNYLIPDLVYQDPCRSFKTLWDSINAKRAPWESNPWVVAYTFEGDA